MEVHKYGTTEVWDAKYYVPPFQKNWHKTVGGFAQTKYLLFKEDRSTEQWMYGMPITMSLCFSLKRWEQKNLSCRSTGETDIPDQF